VSVKNWEKFIYSGLRKTYGFEKDLEKGYICLSLKHQIPTTIEKFRSDDFIKENFCSLNTHVIPSIVLVEVKLDNKQYYSYNLGSDGQMYPSLYGYLDLDSNILSSKKISIF